jgi:hypothetical protein
MIGAAEDKNLHMATLMRAFEKIPNVMLKGFLPYVALAIIKKEDEATA